MLQLNLTKQEIIMLFGFLQGVLESVNEKPEMELVDKKNTTALITSILGKVEAIFENQTNN
jgi:hypothetical protein